MKTCREAAGFQVATNWYTTLAPIFTKMTTESSDFITWTHQLDPKPTLKSVVFLLFALPDLCRAQNLPIFCCARAFLWFES